MTPNKFVAVLATSTILSGCGGGGDNSSTSQAALIAAVSSTATATDTPAPPPPAPAPAPPAARPAPPPEVIAIAPPALPPAPPAPPPPTCVVDVPATLTIDTTAGAPINSTDTYVTGRVKFAATSTTPALDATTQVRGRGNTTWGMPKKPYRLKLDSKASVLGMPSDKDWALLANYSDKTLLRNSVAFCLGSLLNMKYVPRQKYAELTLNGQYQGLYQVTEHIKAGASRVAIGTEDTTTDSGYLLEIDARLDGDVIFNSARGTPFVVKSDAIPAQATSIQIAINEFETALFGSTFADPVNGYAKYIDVDSLVDFYLVNELMRNNDAFWSSTFVYKPRGGKMIFGPLWDFDIAAGNINYSGNEKPEGFWLNNASSYINRVIQDPAFKAKVAARWKGLSAKMPELQTFIDTSAKTLDVAQGKNFQKWDILGIYVWPNWQINHTYAGEVTYLKNWLALRTKWLDVEYAKWAPAM